MTSIDIYFIKIKQEPVGWRRSPEYKVLRFKKIFKNFPIQDW